MAELFKRAEAAAYLRVGLTFFKRKVRPAIGRVVDGGVERYEREELDRWVDAHRVGISPSTRALGKCGGRRTANGRNAPQDAETAEIERQLRRQLEKSTQRRSAKAATASNVVPFPRARCSRA